MNRTPRAFTLIELLVVVGIIGLLMGLLTPSFVAIASLAQETSCKNNLLLISKAAGQYMITNNDYLPINDYTDVTYKNIDANLMLPGNERTPKWWCNKVYEYGPRKPKVYLCPSDPGRANEVDPIECGYGANNSLMHPGPVGDGVTSSFGIKDTERTAIIGHCSMWSNEPAIHEEQVLNREWPVGHVPRYDYEAQSREGRAAFVMASGDVITRTFTEASIKDDEGRLILYRNTERE